MPTGTTGARWVLAMVIATTTLTGLSISIMVITFPAIRADFPGASPAQLSWINNLFTIVSAAVLIPCGALADRMGRKRMMLAGTALFAVGSLIGALAPAPEWIMAGRTVQAVGAAAFGPAGTALLIATYPPERMAFAIGIWAVTSGIASSAGPSIGGLIIDSGGWPWAFWINLPICAFVLVLGPFVLRESRRDAARRLPDLVSVALVLAASSTFTLGIVQRKTAPGWGWLGSKTLVCALISVLLSAWFIRRSRHQANPLLRLELFSAHGVRVGTLGLVVTGIAFYAVYWAFVQHTITQWGWSVARAGLITAPTSFTSGLAAITTSRLSHRLSHRFLVIVGSAGVLASCLFLWVAMGPTQSVPAVVIGGIALGVSSGFVAPAFISTTLAGVPAEQHSVGSALNFMCQRTSATIGTALAITFIAGATGSGGLRQSLVASSVAAAAGIPLGLAITTRTRRV